MDVTVHFCDECQQCLRLSDGDLKCLVNSAIMPWHERACTDRFIQLTETIDIDEDE